EMMRSTKRPRACWLFLIGCGWRALARLPQHIHRAAELQAGAEAVAIARARGCARDRPKKIEGLMIVCARRWHFCCRLRDLIAARKGTRQRAAYPETFVHLPRLISSPWPT